MPALIDQLEADYAARIADRPAEPQLGLRSTGVKSDPSTDQRWTGAFQ